MEKLEVTMDISQASLETLAGAILEDLHDKVQIAVDNCDFDDKIEPTDETVEIDGGLKVVIDRKSVLYLYGTELDFSDGLNGKGFQWGNPNASRTCGCGESFAL